jgi:hypothetical protein
MLFMEGQTVNGGAFAGFNAQNSLTNSTTITASRSLTGGTQNNQISVVDFNPAYLNTSTQSGALPIVNATSATATISGVNSSKSLLSWLGVNGNNSNTNRILSYLNLTNGTTVTGTKQSNAAGSTATTSFMVLESK